MAPTPIGSVCSWQTESDDTSCCWPAMTARRLSRVACHLRAQSSAAAEAVPPRVGLRGGTANGLGVQVQQNDDGSVSEEALADVLERKRRAVAAEDYALAAQLHQLYTVLHPASQLCLAECSPPALGDQVDFFAKQGFLVIEGVLQGAELARAQEAWMGAMVPKQVAWEAEREKGVGFARSAGGGFASGTNVARRFFDLGSLSEVDDCFIELMDHPAITPVMTHFAGGGDVGGNPGSGNDVYHGIAQVGGCGGRVLPPDTDRRYSPAPIGYLGWHRDVPASRTLMGPLPSYRHIKGFVYLWDVAEDGGCAAVVPGSHLLGDAGSLCLSQPMASGYDLEKEAGALDHAEMVSREALRCTVVPCVFSLLQL